MGIVAGYPRDLGTDRTAEQAGTNFRITQAWQVLFDVDDVLNPERARTAPGIPAENSKIFGNYYVANVRAEQVEGHRRLYKVVATYELNVTLYQDPSAAPWMMPALISLSATGSQEETDIDRFGKAITNTAGEVLRVPTTIFDGVLNIQKAFPYQFNLYGPWLEFGGTVNESVFDLVGAAPGQAMFQPFRMSEVLDPTFGAYWQCDFEIQLRRGRPKTDDLGSPTGEWSGWDPPVQNLGTKSYKVGDTSGKLHPIIFDGVPVSPPGAPLDRNGVYTGIPPTLFLFPEVPQRSNWTTWLSANVLLRRGTFG